eukprot:m.39136 g.39136  ORF g.39136 m.39136 type:complete len:436 (-) comp18100_c0_seq1:34-1341(-)
MEPPLRPPPPRPPRPHARFPRIVEESQHHEDDFELVRPLSTSPLLGQPSMVDFFTPPQGAVQTGYPTKSFRNADDESLVSKRILEETSFGPESPRDEERTLLEQTPTSQPVRRLPSLSPRGSPRGSMIYSKSRRTTVGSGNPHERSLRKTSSVTKHNSQAKGQFAPTRRWSFLHQPANEDLPGDDSEYGDGHVVVESLPPSTEPTLTLTELGPRYARPRPSEVLRGEFKKAQAEIRQSMNSTTAAQILSDLEMLNVDEKPHTSAILVEDIWLDEVKSITNDIAQIGVMAMSGEQPGFGRSMNKLAQFRASQAKFRQEVHRLDKIAHSNQIEFPDMDLAEDGDIVVHMGTFGSHSEATKDQLRKLHELNYKLERDVFGEFETGDWQPTWGQRHEPDVDDFLTQLRSPNIHANKNDKKEIAKRAKTKQPNTTNHDGP